LTDEASHGKDPSARLIVVSECPSVELPDQLETSRVNLDIPDHPSIGLGGKRTSSSSRIDGRSDFGRLHGDDHLARCIRSYWGEEDVTC
jgi:hypothetical protein